MVTGDSAEAVLDRLLAATNAHDLEGLADCFRPDFTNETPAHPARGFTGREQVRRNWGQIFAAVPDLAARVVRSRVDGDTIWSEWEMTGTRPDGSAHQMAGVVIFGAEGGRFGWARFYLEPVETGGVDIDGAVRRHVGRDSQSAPGATAGPGR